MTKLSEFVVYYRKKGFRETMGRIRSRYFSILTFVHFKRDLSEPFNGMLLGDDCRIVTNDFDLLEQERYSHQDLPREFFIDQTHHGKHFYLLYFQGHLAGICWIFTKGEYSRFFTIRNRTSCELNYIITLPEFRGNNFSSKFTNIICQDLLEKGFKLAFLSISIGNISSLKIMQKTNFFEHLKVNSFCSVVKKVDV